MEEQKYHTPQGGITNTDDYVLKFPPHFVTSNCFVFRMLICYGVAHAYLEIRLGDITFLLNKIYIITRGNSVGEEVPVNLQASWAHEKRVTASMQKVGMTTNANTRPGHVTKGRLTSQNPRTE